MRSLQRTPFQATLKLGCELLLLRPDALLPSSHTHTVIRLLALAPIDMFELMADLNLTSHIHPDAATSTDASGGGDD